MTDTPLKTWADVAPRLVAVAAGREPADLVIRGGKVVNVHTREVLDGWQVAIAEGRFAYVGGGGNSNQRDLYLAQVDENNQLHTRRLTYGMTVGALEWRHDGDWLVFNNLNFSATELYIYHMDWDRPRRLTVNDLEEHSPSWRPVH